MHAREFSLFLERLIVLEDGPFLLTWSCLSQCADISGAIACWIFAAKNNGNDENDKGSLSHSLWGESVFRGELLFVSYFCHPLLGFVPVRHHLCPRH